MVVTGSLASRLIMMLRMSIHTAAYVIVTLLVFRYYKNKELTTRDRVVIGIIFGCCSIASTHFGVNFGTMILNVRDIGPMSAGLFFDPVSGVIAGIIGAFERYIAGEYFKVGEFTTIACSLSTCLAGFFAAFLNMYLFKGKKPSLAYSFFMGCVIEVFHMYMVLVSNRDDVAMAFTVVRICALPMILFTGLGLMVSSALIKVMSGEWQNPFVRPEGDKVTVSHRFQVWLFGVTAVVLLMNFWFNYSLQTFSAEQNARLEMEIAQVYTDYNYEMYKENGLDLSKMEIYIANDGAFVIVDESGNAISGFRDWAALKETLDAAEEHKDSDYFDVKTEYGEWMCKVAHMETDPGKRLLIAMPYDTIYLSRDAQAYETLLADILVFTVIYVLISVLVQSLVVDNLIKVNESLNKITEGDLDEKVSVYNSSEFASLSDDINLTVDALKGYIEAAEKRIEQELMLARTIQASALPKNFDFNNDAFELFATMDPAKEVGGDFYDFFFIDSYRMALVIADVSGKGIPASLFMMRSKTAIRGLTESGYDPGEMLVRVNNELCTNNEASMFVTVWIGIVDLKTGDIRCANAGHEYPAVRRSSGAFESFKDKHGLPLGCMEDMKYREYDIHLDPGDTLFVYTDGVPEAINVDEVQYGETRMLRALSRNKKASMKKLLHALKKDQDGFVGEADQFDDITMLGFRYNGMKEEPETKAPEQS